MRDIDPRWARVWFATTATAVAVGIVIGLVLSAQNPTFVVDSEELVRFGGSALTRALNNFAFFTTQSNLIVGGTCLLLALNPSRSSTVFRVFRLIGLVAINVTFIVFHTALSGLVDLDTWAKTADTLVHTVVPIMAVAGWIMFGPRGLTSARVAKLTVIYPLAYMLFTVILDQVPGIRGVSTPPRRGRVGKGRGCSASGREEPWTLGYGYSSPSWRSS